MVALTYKLVATLSVLCPMNPPNWFVDGVCIQLIKNSAPSVIKVANGSLAVVEFDDNMSQTVRCGDINASTNEWHGTCYRRCRCWCQSNASVFWWKWCNLERVKWKLTWHDSIHVANILWCMFMDLLTLQTNASLWKSLWTAFVTSRGGGWVIGRYWTGGGDWTGGGGSSGNGYKDEAVDRTQRKKGHAEMMSKMRTTKEIFLQTEDESFRQAASVVDQQMNQHLQRNIRPT